MLFEKYTQILYFSNETIAKVYECSFIIKTIVSSKGIVKLTKYLFLSYRWAGKWDKKDLLYCFERNKKKKLSFYNENIKHYCFKKLRCNINKKLKFNGANNCFQLSYLHVGFYDFFEWIFFYENN